MAALIELTLGHSPDPDDAFMWWPIHADGERPVDFEYLYYAGDAHRYRIRIERS